MGEYNRKIKLCIFIGGINRGGVENYIKTMFSHMDRSCFELHLVVHYVDDEEELQRFCDLGFCVHKLHRLKGSRIKRVNIIDYKELFRKNSFDIVYNNVVPNLLPLLFACIKRVPIRILHAHNDYDKAFSSMNAIRRIARKVGMYINTLFATEYFACGWRAAESVYGKRRCRRIGVKIKTNAIETSKYAYNIAERVRIRDELGIYNSPLFGNVGRFEDDQKNQKFIVEIFREIIKINNDAKLILIGDGKKRKEIEVMVDNYGLNNAVIFTGIVNNVSAFYSAIDVFVFPSIWEGLSIASVEAQCSGLCGVMNSSLSSEMNILGLFKEISLEKAPKEWAKEAISLLGYRRSDRSIDIKELGFDIDDQSSSMRDDLVDLYQNVQIKVS